MSPTMTMTCVHFNNLSAPLLSIFFSGHLLTTHATGGDDRPPFRNLGLRKLKRVQQRASGAITGNYSQPSFEVHTKMLRWRSVVFAASVKLPRRLC